MVEFSSLSLGFELVVIELICYAMTCSRPVFTSGLWFRLPRFRL